MDRIEEVKNKLDQHYGESPDGMGNLYLAKLINQLYEPECTVNTFNYNHPIEPQPNQSSRLLTGKDWETINRKAGVDIMDIVINLDGRYSKSQQMDLISERCNLTAKAQLAKDEARIEALIEWLGAYDCWEKSAHLLKADLLEYLKATHTSKGDK